jgi:hypothetical protein
MCCEWMGASMRVKESILKIDSLTSRHYEGMAVDRERSILKYRSRSVLSSTCKVQMRERSSYM